MKSIYYKLVAATLVLFCTMSSCSEWFDVVPFDQMDKEKAYSGDKNMNAILNGLYLKLAQDNLYGKELSIGLLEVMAQHYIIPSKNQYYYISQYNYVHPDSEPILDAVWRSAYQLIAECNEFLEEVRIRKDRMPAWQYDIYYGEAIAIRTLLHFDMLRLFGPIYSRSKEKQAIPYYDKSTYEHQPYLSGEEVMVKLLADIDVALSCLKNDPIFENGVIRDEESEDFFSMFRNFRMNAYAVSTLKARMCLYVGDDAHKATAYELATNIISDINPITPSETTDFSSYFKFMTRPEDGLTEYVFFPEVIFGLQNIQRNRLNESCFVSTLSDTQILAGGTEFHEYLYNNTFSVGGVDPSLRKEQWQLQKREGEINNKYLFLKYTASGDTYREQVQCMMRIGELYLIAAESAPDVEKMRYWVEQLRINRGHSRDNATNLEEFQLRELIYNEFVMETYGEGQCFFFAKRNSRFDFMDQNRVSVVMNTSRYTPPIPDSENLYRTDEEE